MVDQFLVVEADHTFSGLRKPLRFLEQAKSYDWPMEKIDYRAHRVEAPDPDAWQNEWAQRNSLSAVLASVRADDLVLLSDVDEIPRAECVDYAVRHSDETRFGFKMQLSYFKLNFVNTGGPAKDVVWTVGFRRAGVGDFTFDQLRMGIREGSIEARILPDAGWHFSYLASDEGVRTKIQAFSHQELNTPEILERIDLRKLVAEGADLFDRPQFEWQVLKNADLPDYVLQNPHAFKEWLA